MRFVAAVLTLGMVTGPGNASDPAASVNAPSATSAVSSAPISEPAPSGQAAASDQRTQPVLVEMFLSQACRRSPPAAETMTALAKDNDVVLLSWHVDYWNSISSSRSGEWSDPYSSAVFTDRQREYNRRIRGRHTLFTPQAVVDGVLSSPGAATSAIKTHVSDRKIVDRAALLDVMMNDQGGVSAYVRGLDSSYDVSVVRFMRRAATDVTGGDNAGLTFDEINVVTAIETPLDGHSGYGAVMVDAPANDNLGCAILLHDVEQGQVIDARYCPGSAPGE